jgi:hypothetical protein
MLASDSGRQRPWEFPHAAGSSKPGPRVIIEQHALYPKHSAGGGHSFAIMAAPTDRLQRPCGSQWRHSGCRVAHLHRWPHGCWPCRKSMITRLTSLQIWRRLASRGARQAHCSTRSQRSSSCPCKVSMAHGRQHCTWHGARRPDVERQDRRRPDVGFQAGLPCCSAPFHRHVGSWPTSTTRIG